MPTKKKVITMEEAKRCKLGPEVFARFAESAREQKAWEEQEKKRNGR